MRFKVRACPEPGRRVCLSAVYLLMLCTYLCLPSQQYDPDVLPELAAINRLDATSPDPAHMLYTRVGIALYRLWLQSGHTGDALRAMQVLNAVLGAAAVVVLILVMHQTQVRLAIAVPLSCAAGLSYAFWTHTEDAFFIIPAACCALAAWLCSLTLGGATAGLGHGATSLALAASLSLSVLFCQANLLLVPALMASSRPGSAGWRRWAGEWLLVGACATVVAGGVWADQGWRFGQVRSVAEAVAWFLGNHGGIARGLWRREGVPLLTTTLAAWGATVLPLYEGMRLRDLVHGRFSLRHVPSQLALALLASAALLCVRTLWHNSRRRQATLPGHVWAACGLWFALPGAAVLWFDPAEVKLWLIPSFSLWVVAANVLNARWRTQGTHGGRRCLLGLMWSLMLTVGIGNLMLAVWPDHVDEPIHLRKAQRAVSEMRTQDLLVTASFGWTGHVGYLCPECRVISVLGLAQSMPKGQEGEARAFLMQHMEQTWEHGGQVYATEELAQPASVTWAEWITPYSGLVPEDLAGFRREIAWHIEGEGVWRFCPAP